jgi:Uma2 family endonuclease
MLQSTVPLITRYDYQAMREGPPYYQVIEGDLVMSPSPNTFHQRILLHILGSTQNFLEKHPIGELFVAPLDVFLTETNVYQPDIFFVTNEHRSAVTEHGIEGGPDLVIEILSPGTAVYDRGSKRKIYARTGVQELWLVDPDKMQIQIFDLSVNPETPTGTYGPKSVFTSKVLPGLKFKGTTIFKR